MRIPVLFLILLVGLIPLLLFTFFIVAPTYITVGWQPPNIWSSEFGPEPYYRSATTSVLATSDSLYAGGYVGYPRVSAVPNSTTAGIFVARYDLSGHQVWNRLFGDPTTSMVDGVTAGRNGVIVVGRLNLQSFLRNYDLNGTELWTTRVSTSPYGEEEVKGVSGSGTTLYAVGFYRASNLSYVDELHAYDFNGKSLWNSTIGLDTGGVRLLSVYAVSGGAYVASSDYGTSGMSFFQFYDSTGVLSWTHYLVCTPCSRTNISSDGTGVYLGGFVNPPPYALFLNKYDFAGNMIWSHQFYTSYPSGFGTLSADTSGIYFAVQGTTGSHAGFILKYDQNGNQIWSLETNVTPYNVSPAGGGLYVGGSTSGPVQQFGGGDTVGQAFLGEFWQSSSLVFLGLNPPWSFVLAGVILVAIAAVILFLKRYYETKQVARKSNRAVKGVPRN